MVRMVLAEGGRRHNRMGPARHMRSVLAALLVVFGQFASAQATTFVPLNDDTLFDASDIVLTGTVSAIEASSRGPDEPIFTYIHVEPDRALKGMDSLAPLVLREPGGVVGARREWLYGAPEFRVGERVLLFLSRNSDGTLQTQSLSMGKFTLGVDSSGFTTATRDFGQGAGILDPDSGRLTEAQPETRRYLRLLKRLRTRHLAERRAARFREDPTAPGIHLVPPELLEAPTEVQESFTFLGNPSRWFEPDCGLPVNYLVDANGDATLGFATSRAAADAALAAWTDLPTSSIDLRDAGTIAPTTFGGCGTNRILFNDPFNEITDPVGCGGILAYGGFCTGFGNPCSPPTSSVVNGTSFNRIVTGKIMMNNGWGACRAWTPCNVEEVLTHELGHTIGFGHSTDSTATLYSSAHFDGRCASLRSDDVAAANAAYPLRSPAAPAATPTRTPTRTVTRTPTVTATHTPAPTSTVAPPSATASNTVPPTLTKTPAPYVSPTATVPPTATRTPSITPTATPVTYSVSGRVNYYGSGQPVPDATVLLTGPASDAAVTDISGAFAFPSLSPGTWAFGPRKSGDVGLAISSVDAVYVLQAAVGARTAGQIERTACDVSGNGTLTSLDASLILQYTVNSITHFPVAGADAAWTFFPVPAPGPNQQVTRPALSLGIYLPGVVVYDPLAASVTNQNFLAVVFGDCTGNWQPAAALRTGASTARRVRMGGARRGGGHRDLRVPVYVEGAGEFLGLDLLVRFDPTHLTFAGVHRLGDAGHALVEAKEWTPGTIRLALASPQPLRPGRVLALRFALTQAPGSAPPPEIIDAALADP